MARIDVLLRGVRDQSASDLHLTAGSPPVLRVHGEICPVEFQELAPDQCRRLLYEIMTEEQIAHLEKEGAVDFSYEIASELRVRANVYEARLGVAACFHLLPTEIRSAEQLELPREVLRFAEMPRGLVIVTGPPGSGKSSTLAALIDHINTHQRKHIITIEDPIEFMHVKKNSLVNQREVRRHTPSFASALRSALREDPDVVLVGEMRDRETIALALAAAEVGQLVFGTLHSSSAVQAVNRLIDVFPEDEQEQARTVLADSLRGVVAQRLLRRVDRDGRIPAVEILFATPTVSALIRERKTEQIVSAMQAGKKEGMQLLDDAVAQLEHDGKVSSQGAARPARNGGGALRAAREAARQGRIGARVTASAPRATHTPDRESDAPSRETDAPTRAASMPARRTLPPLAPESRRDSHTVLREVHPDEPAESNSL
jgi:twitching motility protein PilT